MSIVPPVACFLVDAPVGWSAHWAWGLLLTVTFVARNLSRGGRTLVAATRNGFRRRRTCVRKGQPPDSGTTQALEASAFLGYCRSCSSLAGLGWLL